MDGVKKSLRGVNKMRHIGHSYHLIEYLKQQILGIDIKSKPAEVHAPRAGCEQRVGRRGQHRVPAAEDRTVEYNESRTNTRVEYEVSTIFSL
ncbi:hypothetical protein PG989_010906 [Apiospora arundinis]